MCQCLLIMGEKHNLFVFLLSTLLSIVTGDRCRCSPDDDCWPTLDQWRSLNTSVHGRLSRPVSPVAPCLAEEINMEDCINSLEKFGEDPFWLQTLPGATQNTGC